MFPTINNYFVTLISTFQNAYIEWKLGLGPGAVEVNPMTQYREARDLLGVIVAVPIVTVQVLPLLAVDVQPRPVT